MDLIKNINETKTSELIDRYKEVTDDDSILFMDIFWQRFPFDVVEDQHQHNEREHKELMSRIFELEKQLKLQTRVLDRIDKLTQSINKRKK